jgi:hypothetical protein
MALVALLFLFFAFPAMTLSPGSGETQSAPPATTTAKTGRASLTMKSLRPLTVAGSGFKAAERVRITGAGTKTLTASRGGAFTTRLTGADPCGLTIVAMGSRGSRASLNFSKLLCVKQ